MPVPLLATKLYVPAPRLGLVPRSRLVARLATGIEEGRGVILVSAPAGFGKTTLMSACSDACGWRTAWLSLDEEDDEPSTFWRYVIAALQTVDPALGREAMSLLSAPQPVLRTVVTLLLNEISALQEPCILVLDDYQAISSREIHDAVAYLLTHLPPTLRVAILTRADPPLPISQLRVRGRLIELRATDLRFTPDEALAFFNHTMGLTLSPKDADAIESRTEGWIAGLQLAALSLQGRADVRNFVEGFTGGHHFVLEYLTDQVLARQPPDVRAFLTETSILERMSGSLCDAVTGHDGGSEMLARLDRDNLFVVPLDDAHRWYRYHHLFADLLGSLLRGSRTSDQIDALHDRASAWFDDQGMATESIKHALAGHAYQQAAGVIEREIQSTLSRGSVATLLRWSEALPPDVARARPRLRMYQAFANLLNARGAEAKALLAEAESALPAVPEAERETLRGEMLAIRATISMVQGRAAQTIDEATEALALLPQDNLTSRVRATRALGVAYGVNGDTERAIRTCEAAIPMALATGNYFLAAETMSQAAQEYVHLAQLDAAARLYRTITELVDPPESFPPSGLGYIGLAGIAYERDELDRAETALEKGIELCSSGGISYGLRPARFTKALLLQARGDTEAALAAVDSASQFSEVVELVEGTVLAASYQVRLRLQAGDVTSAMRWAINDGLVPNVDFSSLPRPWWEMQQVILARAYQAQGDARRAIEIADAVESSAAPQGRVARVLEADLVRALARQDLGDRAGALAALRRCLDVAAPEGYVRLFVEAGSALVPLLQQAAADPGDRREFVGRLLAAVGASAPDAFRGGAVQGLVEPLTKRELEVLQLIADGCSNQQIADRLVVTLNTVKKHTSNIYDKLGVRRRTQAAALARDLGLLQ